MLLEQHSAIRSPLAMMSDHTHLERSIAECSHLSMAYRSLEQLIQSDKMQKYLCASSGRPHKI